MAGIVIEDVKITNLAYSEEIAAAMLQRQQATAIIAARQKIVDGAVGMVKMAIDKLGDEEIVLLDEGKKKRRWSAIFSLSSVPEKIRSLLSTAEVYIKL